MKNSRLRTVSSLLIGVLAVSTAAIFIRFAQKDAPSLIIAAYRLSIATILITPLVLLKKINEIKSLKPKQLGLAVLSGLFLAFHFATWITSLEFTSVASSVVLVTTTPIWVFLLTPLLLRESNPRALYWGIIIAVVGGIIIALSDACDLDGYHLACPDTFNLLGKNSITGDLLALIGAVFASLYLIVGRSLRKHTSLLTYIFIVYGSASVFLIIFSIIARLPLVGYQPSTYLLFLALALIPQLLGHTLFNWSLRFFPPSYVATTILGEPVGSTLLAWIFLGEIPGYVKIIGAILILVGIYFSSKKMDLISG